VRDRLLGALLFLPVPLVLWLFTAAPLGAGPSLAAGVAIMLSHRAVARPFALRRAGRRCLWCGGGAAAGPLLELRDPLGRASWRCCSQDHGQRTARTVATAARWRPWLRAGILGGLAAFLLLATAAATVSPAWTHADAAALFRLSVALAVVPFSFAATRGAFPAELPRVPFPLHVQALIGTAAVLWLFRLVGALWLLQVVRYAMTRGA